MSIYTLFCIASLANSLQLIPGHEAVGKVVKVGSNVKDFSTGDRVVADVGVTVGGDLSTTEAFLNVDFHSVVIASTAAVAIHSCVKTSALVV